MAWFQFSQNNSGGAYIGPTEVWVEADDSTEANERAEREGTVYFDGVDSEQDCECCGDRWSRTWEGAATETLDACEDALVVPAEGEPYTFKGGARPWAP